MVFLWVSPQPTRKRYLLEKNPRESMTEIIPNVSSSWQVKGQLRDAEYPELLDSTMLNVSDGNRSIVIYSGWEPEEDPNGHYEIGVLQGCRLLAGPYRTKNIHAAVSLIEELATTYAAETKATEIARTPVRPRPYDLAKANTATTQTELLCCGRA
jgi:hypothetical protein